MAWSYLSSQSPLGSNKDNYLKSLQVVGTSEAQGSLISAGERAGMVLHGLCSGGSRGREAALRSPHSADPAGTQGRGLQGKVTLFQAGGKPGSSGGIYHLPLPLWHQAVTCTAPEGSHKQAKKNHNLLRRTQSPREGDKAELQLKLIKQTEENFNGKVMKTYMEIQLKYNNFLNQNKKPFKQPKK